MADNWTIFKYIILPGIILGGIGIWYIVGQMKISKHSRFMYLNEQTENAHLYTWLNNGEVKLRQLYEQVIEQPYRKKGARRLVVPPEYMPFDEFCCRVYYKTLKF